MHGHLNVKNETEHWSNDTEGGKAKVVGAKT